LLKSIESFRGTIIKRPEEEIRMILDTLKRENEIPGTLFEAATIDRLLLEEILKTVTILPIEALRPYSYS